MLAHSLLDEIVRGGYNLSIRSTNDTVIVSVHEPYTNVRYTTEVPDNIDDLLGALQSLIEQHKRDYERRMSTTA